MVRSQPLLLLSEVKGGLLTACKVHIQVVLYHISVSEFDIAHMLVSYLSF